MKKNFQNERISINWMLTIAFIILFLLFLISLSTGAVSISLNEIIGIFLNNLGFQINIGSEIQDFVLFEIRLPRVLFTVLVGATLGVSGTVLQGLFRNPLVEPGIIGVSSGSALGAFFIILMINSLFQDTSEQYKIWLLPFFAFLGGLFAIIFTLRLGSYQGRISIIILILAGVAISAMANALIGLGIFYASDLELRKFTFWTLGDLSGATWTILAIIIFPILISIIGLNFCAKSLNAISLGESEAYHSGVNVERIKKIIIFLSALGVGTSVAFAGIIGFVGLIVPHVIRMILSSDHRILIPISGFGGASLLLIADLFARTVVLPAELPIGVITATLGTPFFIYLLVLSKRKNIF